MVEVLGPLSARPPTPPRTASRMLSEKDRTEDSPVIVQTPGDSPFSANNSTGAPSTRQSKRVNFSPWTKYIKPPSFTNSTVKLMPDLKTLPPSNECKPAKSILKATNSHAPVNTADATPFTPESFAMLLESITQQLAGDSTSSRLDAYMQFFGALRAYEGLPGEQEIVEKLGLITQFIQRDLGRDLENGGPLDINLVIQALKLAAALSWHPEISTQLSDDFKIFLVDHAINCLQDSKMPKSVLTHYMSILSTQNFHAKIMTNARFTRLLTVLHDITSRVNGNAIISQRLSIYQRVLNQSKSIFVSQAPLWIEHLISGLLHHIKDTRLKAISLGFQTSMTCGPNPTLSKSIRDIFDRSLDNGRKLVSEICERMSRMMASAETGVHVPQVWSIIILLLRSKRFTIDRWEHFKEWVLVLQRCFNCSDPSIKAQAILGWNRFVYVVSPSDTTSRSMLKMLNKPIMSQFERKKQEKQGAQPSQLALCSYHNLLYYAFRPSATHQHLDVVWEEYIAAPSNIFAPIPSHNDRFAQALSNMLWSAQAKVWEENKVNESTRLDPEELPSIDCKWIRSRITTVLKVFETILKSSVWTDDIEKSNISAAWVNLSKALSFASSKEVTPSPESMQAVAHVLGLLQRIWNAGPSSLNAVGNDSMDRFFERFRLLSITMISSLGNIPFTEKLLLKTADETFQAANTPTHHPSRANANLDSPILHFLRLISDVSGISEPTPSYLHLINGTLEAACNGKVSRGSRLELLQQCADLYPNETEFHFGVHNFAQLVWISTAQLAANSLSSFPLESARERDGSVSRDYENIVKILSTGLKFSNVFPVWNQLVDSLVRVVRTERGDRAIAAMIIEPLAECMMSLHVKETYLPSTSLFTHSLSIPYCQQPVLSLIENNADKNASSTGMDKLFFPHQLVRVVNRTLEEAYGTFNSSETTGFADFIESLTSFLGSGVQEFRSTILERFQKSLALWLKDESRKLNVENGVESRILTACRALASAVLNILQLASTQDALSPQKFEYIICAGLESSHISIAKRFVEFWNSTSGLQESLAYTDSLSRALQKLEPDVDLQLPAVPLSGDPQVRAHSKSALLRKTGDPIDMSIKSRISYILGDSFEASHSPGFSSSPVTNENESAVLSLEGGSEPIIHKLSQGESKLDPLSGNPSMLFTTNVENPKRSDVFSIIESLRSSSPPMTTPRELGFMTPPHLRHLRNPSTDAESPQTPTLPAVPVDNEDGFLCSSPTPGTRGRTPASRSAVPSSLATQVMDSHMDIDPPSSPPEIKSLSPNSHNKREHWNSSSMMRSGSEDQGASSTGKENILEHFTTSNDQPTIGTSQNEQERPAAANEGEKLQRRRLRSSTSKTPIINTPERLPNASPDKRSSKPVQTEDNRSDSSEKVIAPEVVSKNNQEPAGDIGNGDGTDIIADYIADSCSEDVETQIASQLEQDMEFAFDSDVRHEPEQTSEPETSQPIKRKRKRETEEVATPPNKERRQSSRLSSKKAPRTVDVQEVRSTRATRSTASSFIQKIKSSPVESLAKRRKRQSKGNTDEPTPTELTVEKGHAGVDKDTETLDSSPQKRRSSRLGGLAAPLVAEESPSRKQSPRNPRSRRQSTKNKENSLEGSNLQNAGPSVEDPVTELPDQTQETSQEAAVESNNVPDISESQTSLHQAPEGVADTEMSETGGQIEEPSIVNDTPMNDADTAVDHVSSNETTEQVRSQTTQTEPTAEADNKEIISSLRKVLDDVKLATLDRSALKEIDDLLFDIRVETHEALRRHTS